MNYQRASGLTIDGVGELLVDRGFIRAGLSERDVLELLEMLLTPGQTPGESSPRSSSSNGNRRRGRARSE
jgi:hypothetical protein